MAKIHRQGQSGKLQRAGKRRKCLDGKSPLRTTKSGRPIYGCPEESPYGRGARFKKR